MMTWDLWSFFIGCILFPGGYWVHYFGGSYGIPILVVGLVFLFLGGLVNKVSLKKVSQWFWISGAVLCWFLVLVGGMAYAAVAFGFQPNHNVALVGILSIICGSAGAFLLHWFRYQVKGQLWGLIFVLVSMSALLCSLYFLYNRHLIAVNPVSVAMAMLGWVLLSSIVRIMYVRYSP